jgi:short-subunit dehydrogenase
VVEKPLREVIFDGGRRAVQRGGGAMVLVSALGAAHGLPNMAHDSAAKAHVLSLGEALNHELRPAEVKIMVMMPGSVDTSVIDALGLDRDHLPLSPLPVGAEHTNPHQQAPRG